MLEYYFFLNAAGSVSLRPFELSVPLPQAPALPDTPEDPEKTGDGGNGGNMGEAGRIRFLSPAVRFLVRAPGEAGAVRSSRTSPRLSWKETPALLRSGEEAEFTLVHQGWDPRLPLPSPQSLMPRTPVGAILEASPPREDDEAAGILLRLRLIPLEEGRLNIPGFSVSAGDYSLDIPALSVPVSGGSRDRSSPGPASASSGSSREGVSLSPEPPAREHLPFPETALNPLLPFRARCGSIRDTARALWDRGLRAEALAELRRNERDYAGGPALIPLRREAEKSLGLFGNGDETWRPRLLLAGIFLISAGLALASLFLGFLPRKRVTPGLAWCYKGIGKLSRFKKPAGPEPAAGKSGGTSGSCEFEEPAQKTGVLEQPYLKRNPWFFRIFTVVFALPAFFSLWRLGGSLPEFPLSGSEGPARPALTREAEAFRVPGPEGTVAFRFEEGRRVLVRSLRGEWAYAEIPGREEGRKAGWVKIEALVFY
jgi:hypothetical protein